MGLSYQREWQDLDNRRMGNLTTPTDPDFSLDLVNGNVNLTTDVGSSLIAAQGAGKCIYVTDILVTCASAAVGTYVELRDGNGGTVKWKGYAAAGGGGFAITFKSPLRFTANTALYAKCVTDASDVWVNASGYVGV